MSPAKVATEIPSQCSHLHPDFPFYSQLTRSGIIRGASIQAYVPVCEGALSLWACLC